MRPGVTIREVGLRDGLQLVKPFVATEHKLEWCRDDVNAGVREIEITSFVPPSVVPQFSDALELVRETLRIDGLITSALVPNLKGAQRAFESGVHKVNYVLSASEAHNQANVRRSTRESLDDFKRITQERCEKNLPALVVGGIATSLAVPFRERCRKARSLISLKVCWRPALMRLFSPIQLDTRIRSKFAESSPKRFVSPGGGRSLRISMIPAD